MNEQGKKALVKVAEWLEAGAPHVSVKEGVVIDQFNMEYAVSAEESCGTACCVAGAVCQFEMLGERDRFGNLDFYSNKDAKGAGELATEYLGISEWDAAELFVPWEGFSYDDLAEFSAPKRAAAVIRHFLETDQVDWDLFDENGQKVEE